MYSNQAKERFESFSPTEQNILRSLIETADKREMLFPTKADGVLIKRCSGKGNEDTYELRDVPSGIRIYFQLNMEDEVLQIGGIATKADGDGPEQSADINRASEACRRMKES